MESNKDDMFEITRKIELDAAHRVPDHASKCFHLHGHRYVVEATVVGKLAQHGEEKGMVMDYGFLKDYMTAVIHDPCDHGLIIYDKDKLLMNQLGIRPHDNFAESQMLKLFWVADVPTAENLARIWFELLHSALEQHLKGRGELKELIVYETPNSKAVYTNPDLR